MRFRSSGGGSRASRVRRASFEQLEQRMLMAADLTAAFTTVPTAFLPGGKNKIVVRVSNGGDTAVTGATLGVSLFASTDDQLDGGDLPVFSLSKKLSVKALGGGTNVNLAFPSPANIPDGDYRLLAQVDSGNVVTENDENNNVGVSSGTVQIRQPFVEIAGTSEVAAGTFSIVAGKKPKAPKVALTVTNTGNVSAAGTLTANVFASRDDQASANDVQIGTVTKKLNAKPNKVTKVAAKVALPQDLRSGQYNIVTTYSYTGTVPDSNAGNNNAASSAKITIDNPAFPPGALVGALAVDSPILAVNSPEQLIFDIPITEIPAGDTVTVELTEVMADGTVVGKVADMLDNGSAANSDGTAGDGVFSTNTAISFTAPGDRFFRATIGGTTSANSATIKVTGINPPSEQDVQNTITNANTRQAALSASVSGGTAPSAAIQQAAANLAGQPDVQPGTIRTGSAALSYLNFQGILTYLTANPNAVGGTSADFFPDAAALQAAVEEGGFFPPTNAALEGEVGDRAIVLSSFPSNASFAFEATLIANKLLSPPSDLPSQVSFNVAGPTFEAGVDAYKGLGQNKVIYFSGESVITADGIAIKSGETATAVGSITRVADLASQRIAVGGDGKYILTPRFFSHYNGDMDGAIVFADVDNSTQDNSLAFPFLRRGAKAFYGYTTSAVSDGVAASIATTTLDRLIRGDTVQAAGDNGGAVLPDGVFTFFGTAEAKLELGTDLISENDLFVTYTWNQNVRDLDTATEFLGASAGFSCSGPNEFMTFTGDNTSGGGSETVTIDLNAAFQAGMLTNGTLVSAMAGWFASAGGSGPAVLTVGLRDKVSGEERQVLTRSISPGTQSDCATTLVGVVTINLTQEASPRVAITLA